MDKILKQKFFSQKLTNLKYTKYENKNSINLPY